MAPWNGPNKKEYWLALEEQNASSAKRSVVSLLLNLRYVRRKRDP